MRRSTILVNVDAPSPEPCVGATGVVNVCPFTILRSQRTISKSSVKPRASSAAIVMRRQIGRGFGTNRMVSSRASMGVMVGSLVV